jgi:hypothetical protein
VAVQAWSDAGPEFADTVRARVEERLDEVPLHHRPRVTVTVQERKGPR